MRLRAGATPTAREMLMPRRGWGRSLGAGVGDERATGGFDAVFEDGGEIGAGADAVGFGE